jgi:hypothetical protein
MKIILLFMMTLLCVLARANCVQEIDLEFNLNVKTEPPLEATLEAPSTKNFDTVREERRRNFQQSAEQSLRAVFRRARMTKVRNSIPHSSISDNLVFSLRGAQSYIALIPFAADNDHTRLLVAFTKKQDGYEGRQALFSDGSTDYIETHQELVRLIQVSLHYSNCSVEFDPHCSPEELARLDADITDLSNDDFEKRESASAHLRLAGMKALVPLTLGAKSVDAERQTRCCNLLKDLELLMNARQFVEQVRTELGLKNDPALTIAVPAEITMQGENAVVCGETHSLKSLRERHPDIYAGLVSGN